MATETVYPGTDWTVPSGVTEVTALLEGQHGQSAYGGDGLGTGGLVEGTLSVSEGETLYIRSSPGGVGISDGGNSVDIRRNGTTLSDRIAVAAGGGAEAYSASGGDGGADTGQSGGDTGGGGGGTQTSGGAGGSGQSGGEGDPGEFGAGGDGASTSEETGGGGAGWYGGGGGGYSSTTTGGGGGGSNYDDGLNTVSRNERGSSSVTFWDDPKITLTYEQAPSAPLNTSQSVDGDDAITITYDEDTNGGVPDNYRIQVSEDGSGYSTIATPTGESYTYAATPSTNSHQFRVRAENSVGDSNWSYTSTVDTDPVNLSVTGIQQSEISFAWDGVRDATGYEVLRAESSGSVTTDYSTAGSPSSSPYTDTGLEDGERYYYRVRATYSSTPSQLTGEVDATTPLPAPTIDVLDTTTAREITVGYTLSDDSTDGDLTIERSDDGGATWAEVATVTDLSATAHTDTSLLDGEEYAYRLTRATDHESAQSGIASAVTVLPAPTGLTQTAVSNESVSVSWSASHNNGDTRVEYSEDDDGVWTAYSTVPRTAESETIDGLLNGQLYGVRVVAQTDHTETEDQ